MKSLMAFVDSYTVIDIETTGLSRCHDNIIEISAVKVINREPTDKFDSFVNPKRKISPFITELTGLSNDDVSAAPVLEDIIAEFLEFIGNDYIVGHNVTFDIGFITKKLCDLGLYSKGICNEFIDTMYLGRAVFPDKPHHQLSDICSMLNVEYKDAHKSINDCYITQKCYEAMRLKVDQESIDISNGNSEYWKYLHSNEHTKSSSSKKSKYISARDIITSNEDFDEEHPLYQKVCVFTGEFSISRAELMQKVADVGGINGDSVTKKTDYLIVGDYQNQRVKDGKSSKLKKAESMILNGSNIAIISEDDFFDLLNNKDIFSEDNFVKEC